jgi:hypothetical protein
VAQQDEPVIGEEIQVIARVVRCMTGTAERVGNALLEAFSELDDWFEREGSVLDLRPEYEGAWTILEHLEHVSLTNHFLLLTIKKGCRICLRRTAGATLPEGESDLDLLAPVAVPGEFAWDPPGHMIPTGSRAALEIRAELSAQRAECLGLLEAMTRGEGRLYSIRMSVNRLGRLDMYQWLYFLAQHARYHLRWMENPEGCIEKVHEAEVKPKVVETSDGPSSRRGEAGRGEHCG